MTKIEELRTLLNNMHIPARINTGGAVFVLWSVRHVRL